METKTDIIIVGAGPVALFTVFEAGLLGLECVLIDNLDKFPTKTIFIEDRVQGGSFGSRFSYNFMDISLYSTGMDKKPCGLGGGVMYIKDSTTRLNYITSVIENKVRSYEQEYFWDRLLF